MSATRALWLAGGWTAGWYLFWRLPMLQRSRRSPFSRQARRRVAVIIPARNEAHALPDLLAGVVGVDRRVAEIVVVDDGSTDATASVARAAGATVIQPGPPAGGSTGKSWACTTGVRSTSSDVLVFVDADVTFADGGLTAVIDKLEEHGGLLSVEPYQRVRHTYERVSAFFGVVSVMGTGAGSPGRHTIRTAFGPVLACRRSDYDAVGGHAAEPTAIAEDVALAARFERSGRRVSIFGGGDLISFRMYPGGPQQMIEGWSKNMATGAQATPLLRLAMVVLWVGAVLSSVIGLVGPAVAAAAGDVGIALPLAFVVWAAFSVQLGQMFRQLGGFGALTAVAYPLLAIAFVAIFGRSLYLTAVRREVRWKGRSIPLQPSHPDL